MTKPADSYDQNVFINCPFDNEYQPIFKALVFAAFACGLRPRCALEVYDAGESRFDKIARIIGECRWGIHDISRTEMNANGLPRFNMPLELGIFLGARRFGNRLQKQKSCLVLDRDQYRYQEYISDIAGQDIAAHRNDVLLVIKAVRDWLGSSPGSPSLLGVRAIATRFAGFTNDLPTFCARTEREVGDLTFVELADAAATWLIELKRVGART